MKTIELKLSNGDIWRVPLMTIAQHKAKHYSKDIFSKEYLDIVEQVMNDNFEGIDWMQNNMNYEDFKDDLDIITNKREADWTNAEYEIKGLEVKHD
jgi:hypothetical protein